MTVWNEKILDFEVDILTMIVYIVVETNLYSEKLLYLTEKMGYSHLFMCSGKINNVSNS
jgi:hypothetical protein